MKGCRPLLSREERGAALAACQSPREACLLTLGFHLGYRISELLSLRVCDVVDSRGAALRHVQVKGANTKTGEGRTVVMNSAAQKAAVILAKTLIARGLPMTTPLFIGAKSLVKSIGRVQAWRLIKAIFDKAAIYTATGTHSMRKTFAAQCYELLGHSIEKVMIALGHKSITSTVAYLSFNHHDIDEALMAFE